jgi:TonB-dependent SusC/RagA subfamily outer membrane receptor
VGNTISQINVAEVVEPARDIGSLLQGRLVGVTVFSGSGNSGSGSDIKLRGNVSATMSNSPLIYIDGVRAKSEPYPATGPADGRGVGGAIDFASPLGDINPDDIERIEIVKGPAATTLYGTEAAAGVIQIFTKRGGSGQQQWTVEARQGFSRLRPFGTEEGKYGFIDPILRKGHRQQFSTSFGGGNAEQVSYFASAQYEDNNGIVINDWEKQVNVRGNIQFRPNEDWLVQVNNSFTSTELNNVEQGSAGVLYQAIMGDLTLYKKRDPAVLENGTISPNGIELNRNVHGLTINHTPVPAFTQRITLGHDDSRHEATRLTPFGLRDPIEAIVGRSYDDLGSLNRVSTQNQITSVDYVGTLAFDATSSIRNSFSFGMQGVENEEETLWAAGDRFPGPGDYTISSAAVRSSFQRKSRVITGGFFFQDMLAFADRYFLTVGVRIDGNSAFGSGFGLQPYPKLSASYVVSDEGFWPESVGTMKLRAAYGWAGRAPGAFDAVKTWLPQGWGTNEAAYIPGNLGNAELGPERTAEVEVGFDGAFLNDRLKAEYTFYSKKTTDALMAVASAPSSGAWNPQLENVGVIKNSGHELMLNAAVLSMPKLRWDLGVGVATNKSKVVSLGGAPPFLLLRFAWIMEGQPVPVYRGDRIENYFEAADPVISKDVTLGPGYPPHTLNFNTSFTLPGNVLLSGRGEYQGEHFVSHHMERIHLSRNIPLPPCYPAFRRVDPNWVVGPPGNESLVPKRPTTWPSDMLAWERAKCFGYNEELSVTPVRFFELRDITLSVPLSTLLPTLAGWGKRTDLTMSARNVWGWKNREIGIGHPEQEERQGIGSSPYPLERRIGNTLPAPSFYTVSIRAVF